MLHSQKLTKDPLLPWVLTEQKGKVLCAHCTCMAGLAEACSHVASILFWIDITVKVRDSKTVTDKSWFYNLRVTSCELRVTSCFFKKIKLRVTSSFLRVENKIYELQIYITSWIYNYELRVPFYEFENKLYELQFISRVASYFLRVAK